MSSMARDEEYEDRRYSGMTDHVEDRRAKREPFGPTSSAPEGRCREDRPGRWLGDRFCRGTIADGVCTRCGRVAT